MELSTALQGMDDAKARLRSRSAATSPSILSEQMYRLGQYTSAVEEHLAGYEEDYERQEGEILRAEMVDLKHSATAAATQVKIELGELEGQIKRLSRIVAASWKQSNTAMARYNHLIQELKGHA